MVKKVILINFLLLTLLNCAYKEILLNGEWDFYFKSEELNSKIPSLPPPENYDIQIVVPDYIIFQVDRLAKAKYAKSDWKDKNFIKLEGLSFYRKYIDIPYEWKGKSIQLYIGRAYDRIFIWLNGKFIAYYPYSCLTPFCTDIDKEIKFGEKNEIVICVDNGKTFTSYKWGNRKYGGIVGNVKLLVSNGPCRIDSLYIQPGVKLNEIIWNVNLKSINENIFIENSELKWTIKEWKTEKIIAKGNQKIEKIQKNINLTWKSEIKNLKLWHPNHPNLYIAELNWEKKDGTLLDTLTQRFGVRKWSSEGRILKLNGKPIYLRQYYTELGAPTHYRYPQDKTYWIKFFQLLKKIGYNSVDFHYDTTVPVELLEASDEVGIVVQTGGSLSLATSIAKDLNITYENIQFGPGRQVYPLLKNIEMWENIVKWTRIYPSMSIYCLTGEGAYYEGFMEDIEKINNIIKNLHPESLLLPNQAMCGIEYNFLPDDKPYLMTEPFFYHPERLEKISKIADIFGCVGAWFSYYPLEKPYPNWQELNKRYEVYKRPIISHEVMESSKPPTPFPEDGYFQSLRYGKKPIEHLCTLYEFPMQKNVIKNIIDNQKNSDSPRNPVYCKNMWRLHGILCKYVFEKIRKCNNIIGYQDLNGHGNLNLFLEPASELTFEEFSKFNNDSVLLLDFDRGFCVKHNYWEKENFEGKLMISHYGEENICKADIYWGVKKGSSLLLNNHFKIDVIPTGKVTILKELKFKWPEVEENSKVSLVVKLVSSTGEISNSWDFWIFKRKSPPDIKAFCSEKLYSLFKDRYKEIKPLKNFSNSKLWILDNLDLEAIQHLERGGNILLVGGNPFPLHSQWKTFNQGWRNHHTHGSVIYPHPVFKNIPHEGWGDWQFYPLFEDASSVIFVDNRISGYASKPVKDPKISLMKEIPFKPIIEILHRTRQSLQASMFELKTEKGRIFVTTLNFNMEDPICVTLMDNILEYMVDEKVPDNISNISLNILKKFISGRWKLLYEIEAGNFEKKENVEIVQIKELGIERGIRITSPKSKIETEINLKSGKYAIYVRGYGGDTTSDAFYITINNQKKREYFDKLEKKKIQNIEIEKEEKIKISFTYAEPNVIIDKIEIWEFVEDENIGILKSEDKKIVGVIWQNKPFKIKFDSPKWFKINEQDWKEDIALIIEKEGVYNIFIKQNRESTEYEEKKVGIDLTPPIMEIVTIPSIEQREHQNIGNENTLFIIKGQDNLSGIQKIEVSIDSEPYKIYTGGFKLKKGTHIIQGRCTDNAGNQTQKFKGASEEGFDIEKFVVIVE